MPTQPALIRQLYVKIAGAQLETEVMNDLFRVEVESSLHVPSMCVLSLHDTNARWTNADTFALGAEIQVGVADEQGRGETRLFVGEITGLEPDFGEGTVVDLTVRAYDRSHRLHRGAHTRTYQNMTDSDIAGAVAQAVGLQAEVDATSVTHEHVYQHGQTHMAFLRERARLIGRELTVRDRTLCFKEPQPNGGEAVSLEWGVQLKSFRPIMTLGDQVNEVTVKGWDAMNKRELVGQAQRGQAAPQIGDRHPGGEVAQQALGEAADLIVRAGVQSQSEADVVAQSVLEEHESAFVEAEGKCQGTPALQAGCTVEISALGARFSGRYRVTSARHLWATSQDYVTWFRVTGRRGDTLRELVADSAAVRDRWPLMTGVVTNNNDPENQGRVRCKFPWLDGDLESGWARVVGLGAAGGRGAFCLPEVNDEVLVGFEQGDMGRPFVLGGLWSGAEAPPISASDAVVNGNVVQRVWVTRAGHKVVFSDENPATIRVESVAGHKLMIDDDNAKIELTTAGGNTLVLDDNGRKIAIQSGGEIALQASTNLSVKASGNMNLEASGTLTVKGSIIQLNP
jgi:phage protein D/phage baseplate assembly protein gpV